MRGRQRSDLPLVMPFGKYLGRPLKEIAKSDPAYLNWLIVTLASSPLREAAQESLSAASLTRTSSRPPSLKKNRARKA